MPKCVRGRRRRGQSARWWAGRQRINSQVSSNRCTELYRCRTRTPPPGRRNKAVRIWKWRPSCPSRVSPRLFVDSLSLSRTFQLWASIPVISACTALQLLLTPSRRCPNGSYPPPTRLTTSAAQTRARPLASRELSLQGVFQLWPDSCLISTAARGSP